MLTVTRSTSTFKELTEIGLVHLRDGRFQRSMSLVAAASSFVSGLEVAYEHYKGSYSNPVMYTPVLLSGVLTVAGIAGAISETAATSFMRWTGFVTLIDGMVGFGFHIRGIQRKPGGWRIPLVNIVMGPPIFAPLLFGTAAYLGFLASYLRPEETLALVSDSNSRGYKGWRLDLHHGRFQKHLAIVSGWWAVLSGFEAWYSHYKNRFRYWAQWTPIVLAPVHVAVCIAAVVSKRAAWTALPVSSALAAIDGSIGFVYHARGVMRRPGAKKHLLYNILYGPPIFAPLLFSACGLLGLLAAALRRERP